MNISLPEYGREVRFTSQLILVCLAVMWFTGCSDSRSPLKVNIGQVVSPLSVKDLDNQPVTLQPGPGKLLMINVWATWCAPCRHEMPSLQRLADAIGPEHFELVGLSVDHDEHVVREYLIEQGIRFPSYLDRQFASVNGIFGVRVFPSTFFLAPDGTLLKVVESWRDWDSPEMLAEVRNLLPDEHKTPGKVLN